jgi:uncharacterized protein (DUF2236 family)
MVHTDNARPHVAKRAKQYRGQQPEKYTTSALLSRLSTEQLFLFSHVKRLLQRTEFQTTAELLDRVVRILADIPLETLMTIFHEWLQRLQHALTVMGNMWNKHSLIQKNFRRISTGN